MGWIEMTTSQKEFEQQIMKMNTSFETLLEKSDTNISEHDVYKNNIVNGLYAVWVYQQEKIDTLTHASDKAFSVLSACGIPKERAVTIGNGILVYQTRIMREIDAMKASVHEALQHDNVYDILYKLLEEWG